MKRLMIVFALACLVSSCAVTRQARLYDVGDARVLSASYRSSGSGRGAIWIGEACHGEYVTVAPTALEWGTIYSGAHVSTIVGASVGGDQRGSAIITCRDGRVIDCEYLAGSGGGHGACRDNRGRDYRLMF